MSRMLEALYAGISDRITEAVKRLMNCDDERARGLVTEFLK
jgi:hypothetical protein